MKNILNQDLVCDGASGEWVLGSGEWILGSGEWLVDAAEIRRWKYRRRARKLLRRLARQRELVAAAAWRGAGLGLALTFVESLLYLPFFLGFKVPMPIDLIAAAAAFNLLLGAALALVLTPLLRLQRGGLWHALGSVGLLVLLVVGIEGPFPPMSARMAAAGLAVAYLAGLGLARWQRVGGRRALALGALAATAAFGLPHLLTAGATAVPERIAASAAAPEGAPNVLFIVLDTLRADRLDVMGYERATFPWLTDFSREGAVFERALSAAPWTVPSHASMFTGLYPSGHGAHHENLLLEESRTTLAEILRRRGWETLALSSNPWISRRSGLSQGFQHAEPVWMTTVGTTFTLASRSIWNLGLSSHDLSGRKVTERWLGWLDSWNEQRPFFAFLNYAEPHMPYHVLPRDHLTAFSRSGTSRGELIRASKTVTDAEAERQGVDTLSRAHVNDLYDASIRYQGQLVARSIEALRERGVLDETIVVLVSDHGDLLGEHGGLFQHTRSLVDDLLSVPLIVRYPDRVPAGQRIAEPVTTAALMPTVLDLAGLEPPEGIQTRSFAPLFDGDAEAARSPLLAENYKDSQFHGSPESAPRSDFDRLDVRYRSLEEDGWKLIVDSTGKSWLFRPVDDLMETHDLAADHPEVVERLSANLRILVEAYGLGELTDESITAEPAPEIDPATREHLRSLGYLGG